MLKACWCRKTCKITKWITQSQAEPKLVCVTSTISMGHDLRHKDPTASTWLFLQTNFNIACAKKHKLNHPSGLGRALKMPLSSSHLLHCSYLNFHCSLWAYIVLTRVTRMQTAARRITFQVNTINPEPFVLHILFSTMHRASNGLKQDRK